MVQRIVLTRLIPPWHKALKIVSCEHVLTRKLPHNQNNGIKLLPLHFEVSKGLVARHCGLDPLDAVCVQLTIHSFTVSFGEGALDYCMSKNSWLFLFICYATMDKTSWTFSSLYNVRDLFSIVFKYCPLITFFSGLNCSYHTTNPKDKRGGGAGTLIKGFERRL